MRHSRKRRAFRFPYVFMVLVAICLALGIISLEYFRSQAQVVSGVNVNMTSSDLYQKGTSESHAKKQGNIVAGESLNGDKEKTTGELKEVEDSKNLENKISELITVMTLQEKVGQLIVVGFHAKQVDSHMKTMIEKYKVGGVILFDRNMESPEQVASLTNDLQELAAQNGHSIPLLLSIDQEGGKIVRLREHVSPIPSQKELGKKGNPEEVYDVALRNGKELAAMGIHVNFAPVLDLSSTDSRSFGTDPTKASLLGREVLAGLADAGVVGTLKHFPGNGRSNIDPHKETSSVQAKQEDLEKKDIYPFKKIIQEVDNDHFFTMVTHIIYPAYDQKNPASISSVIIDELLKKRLGYQGIVVTDDLEMGAVSKYYSPQDLGYLAVKAGADLLLVCHTMETQEKVFNGILQAVKSGKLAEKRIDEAVTKILLYKLNWIKSSQVDPVAAKQKVGNF